MTSKPVNICQAIDCPYNNNSGGCQRFLLSLNCPLPKQPQFADKFPLSIGASQYWLYGSLSTEETAQAKSFMEDWLLNDEQYQIDVETKQAG